MSDPVEESSAATNQAALPSGGEAGATPAAGRAAVMVLVVLLFIIWPSVCYAVLKSLNFYSWYYGADVVAQAAPLTRIRMNLWANVLAAPLQIASILWVLYVLSATLPWHIGITTRRLGRNLCAGVAVWVVITPLVLGLNLLIQDLYKIGFHIAPEEHPWILLAQKGDLTNWEWLLWVSATVVMAPVLEELIFRGILQTWLGYLRRGPEIAIGMAGAAAIQMRSEAIANAWPQGFAMKAESFAPLLFALLLLAGLPLVRRLRPDVAMVWGSSALFAMVHTGVWPTPVPLFVLGLALGELFRRTGSLVGPMVVHALFNGTSVVLFFIQEIAGK